MRPEARTFGSEEKLKRQILEANSASLWAAKALNRPRSWLQCSQDELTLARQENSLPAEASGEHSLSTPSSHQNVYPGMSESTPEGKFLTLLAGARVSSLPYTQIETCVVSSRFSPWSIQERCKQPGWKKLY